MGRAHALHQIINTMRKFEISFLFQTKCYSLVHSIVHVCCCCCCIFFHLFASHRNFWTDFKTNALNFLCCSCCYMFVFLLWQWIIYNSIGTFCLDRLLYFQSKKNRHFKAVHAKQGHSLRIIYSCCFECYAEGSFPWENEKNINHDQPHMFNMTRDLMLNYRFEFSSMQKRWNDNWNFLYINFLMNIHNELIILIKRSQRNPLCSSLWYIQMFHQNSLRIDFDFLISMNIAWANTIETFLTIFLFRSLCQSDVKYYQIVLFFRHKKHLFSFRSSFVIIDWFW